MARKKQFKAVIQDKDFFESCLWMSYRYCIGRKTIAAACHAADIAKYVHYLSKECREFMAHDIRREISDKIRWRDNVTVDGYNGKYDALSLIYKYMINHPETVEDKNYHFYVNVDTGEVYTEDRVPKESSYYTSLLDEHTDYIRWIKLANFCDDSNHKIVHVDYEGEEKDIECIEYPCVYQKEITIRYTDVETFPKNSYVDRFIAHEYIKSVR